MYINARRIKAYAGLTCTRCGHSWNEQSEDLPNKATEVSVLVRYRVDETCEMCGKDEDNELG